MWSGGASTASFDMTGQHLLTAGNDGAVLLHLVKTSQATSMHQLPDQPEVLGPVPDVDAVDEASELTQVIAFNALHCNPLSSVYPAPST